MRIKIKLAVIAVLLVILAVPLSLVVSKIYERSGFRDEARFDIARSWTGEQHVIGPLLVVNYQRVERRRTFDEEARQYVMREQGVDERLILVPELLTVETDLQTETRYRGIYEVPVYTSNSMLAGAFATDRIKALYDRDDVRDISEPRVVIAVSDARGIGTPPQLELNGKTFAFRPGSSMAFQQAGIHAPLDDVDGTAVSELSFAVTLELRGMSSFGLAPVGELTEVSTTSPWLHPRFDGLYLPVHREISSSGFVAAWKTSRFATNSTEQANSCARGDCSSLATNYLGVTLVEPVDVYTQAQRATKYGMLFIGLTFTAFFLYEVMRKLAIHPIQYGLVGLALAIFYLLLVSLAEFIAFGYAYLLAGAACCGLLAFYVTYVLGSFRRGLGFGGSVAALYGVLYVIISAEDFAFAMGAILVFLALTAVMFATRRIDWYAVGNSSLSNGPDA